MKTLRLIQRAIQFFSVLLILSSLASATSKEKVLYSFTGGSDGSIPAGGVVFDSAGNLYGANILGGAKGSGCPSGGCGVVFELSPPTNKGGAWTETTIYTFQGFNQGNDGFSPYGGLIIDAKGNLYGTTAYGGTGSCTLLGGRWGCGTVYELSPPQQKGGKWAEKILYSFQGSKDGYFAQGDLVFDANGNLYGATRYGGGKGTSCNILYGGQCGTVFELSPPKQQGGKWTEKVLHSFAGIASGKQNGDGAEPNGGLILDEGGAVYGTTYVGGYNCPHSSNQGCGTVFRLVPPIRGGGWKEALLHVFTDVPDGGGPLAGVVFKGGRDLYGTTEGGGGGNSGSGTVFKLARNTGGSWVERVLYSFQFGNDGALPEAGLVFDAKGNVYGTASAAGEGFGGTLFELRPTAHDWTFSVPHAFTGSPDGAGPAGDLTLSGSSVFGTTHGGGTGTGCQGGCGTVFEATR